MCFKCDGKWQVGHRCNKRELSVLLSQGEEDDEGSFLLSPSTESEENGGEGNGQPEVSLNSVVGLTTPKTIKLVGVVKGAQVVIMIDPGATHNFISEEAVQRLSIAITPTKDFGVTLGTGESVNGKGVCKNVAVWIQGIEVVEDFLPLKLGNSDLILGIAWLEKLGTMSTNWKTQTVSFRVQGETVTIKGDPSLGKTLISLKAMIRTLKKTGTGFLVELNCLAGEQQAKESSPEWVEPLLQPFAKVFHMPVGLPPHRTFAHAINLKAGTEPVTVRP